MIKKIGYILLFALITGCATRTTLAPVVEGRWAQSRVNQHIVSRGETLYSIAFRYDLDYRRLAMINHLSPPYIVRVGQALYLNGYAARPHYYQPNRPSKNASYSKRAHVYIPTNIGNVGRWRWPANGQIMTSFAPGLGRKGIDIGGKKGQKIYAAGAGVVAYAGHGLSGYGNLIIIKHNERMLTAYGHNSRNLVREGQHVAAGQTIAEMGLVNRQDAGVHFEMRQSGKPINPLYYLTR